MPLIDNLARPLARSASISLAVSARARSYCIVICDFQVSSNASVHFHCPPMAMAMIPFLPELKESLSLT